jgi:hypothetical protein
MAGPAKALRRVGYDLGLNSLGDYFKQQREKDEQNELYKNVVSAFQDAQNKQKSLSEGFDPNDITFEAGQSATVKNNALDVTNPVTTTANPFMPLGINPEQINPSKPQIDVGTPGDYVLGDAILDKDETYKRSQSNVNDFQSSVLPMLMNPNANPNMLAKVNALSQLLSDETALMKPKDKRLTPVSENTNAFVNEEGEVIPNEYYQKDVVKEGNPFVKEGADGFIHKWDSEKGEFVKTNLKAPVSKSEGGTGNDMGDPLDTYKFVEKINSTKGKVEEIDATLKNTKPATKDSKNNDLAEPLYQYGGKMYTGKELQAMKKKFEGELKGGSDSMISYLEENRYRGITKLTNELWNDIKDTEPEKINTIIKNKLNSKEAFKKLPENVKQDLLNNLSSYFQVRKY